MLHSRFQNLPPSPFARLARLLDAVAPGGRPVIDMALGEPKHGVPDFVSEILLQHDSDFGRYPPARGTSTYRQAVADWINTRYRLAHPLDPERHVLPVCGTREALFSIALVAVPEAGATTKGPPLVVMPNPFYQCYAAAARGAGAQPVYLDAVAETGFLPDLDAIPGTVLERTRLFYLCSPANPQGAVASHDYLDRLLSLARRYGFTLVSDECYSEIYADRPPPGLLEACDRAGGDLANIVIFNSLSKRSNLAGLRCGFCAGDEELIAAYLRFRNLAAPQVPLPVLAAGAAAWRDEIHVERSRALYCRKWDDAERLLGEPFGLRRPEGGFFVWLDVAKAGGGEAAAVRLWKTAGLRTLPGAYLAQTNERGGNPAGDYLRIALVHPVETTRSALERAASALGH